ncbi:hypothetical protein FK220_016445 [Flavobacteriaceae bacterium TP-CH-4]|uniref:Lipocalin-like domain-containing protein n=1 Tax=Pelagihabitans pacificus TaxID=2696054 RepID=A0A967AV42_9FLAO|nr:lipocalin family protein [Pelagihabitans pacificus]NHF60944.1 hypothetical protein [Pelagihabitans pacificus]
MKKLHLIVFLATASLFVACEKDSTEESIKEVAVEQSALLGTWEVTGYEIEEGKSVTEADGQRITQEYTSYGKDYDMTVEFNEDPRTVVSNGSYTAVITYSLLGQKYTQEVPAYSLFESAAWSLEGSEIVIGNDGEETRAKIIEMLETKLVMTWDYDEVLETDGAMVTTTGKLTLTLER